MRARSLHPGVTAQEVKSSSGFPVEFPPDLAETRALTEEEGRLLAGIDPGGLEG